LPCPVRELLTPLVQKRADREIGIRCAEPQHPVAGCPRARPAAGLVVDDVDALEPQLTTDHPIGRRAGAQQDHALSHRVARDAPGQRRVAPLCIRILHDPGPEVQHHSFPGLRPLLHLGQHVLRQLGLRAGRQLLQEPLHRAALSQAPMECLPSERVVHRVVAQLGALGVALEERDLLGGRLLQPEHDIEVRLHHPRRTCLGGHRRRGSPEAQHLEAELTHPECEHLAVAHGQLHNPQCVQPGAESPAQPDALGGLPRAPGRLP